MTIFTFFQSDDGNVLIRNGDTVIPDSDYIEMLCGNPPQARQCITCNSSGTPDEFVVVQHDNREYSICLLCIRKDGSHCQSCGQIGSRKVNLTEYSGGEDSYVLCPDCYTNRYKVCRRCCGVFLSENTVLADNSYYCFSCASRTFPKCKYCNNRHIGKNICRCGKTRPKSFLTDRYFSTEIEIVDPNSESRPNRWTSVSDSSISPGGIEYLSGPMVGSNAVDEIIEECSLLGGFVDDTCGFHLHLDFGEESQEDVKKFAAACSVLQNLAFDIVKPNRKDSRYCKPYGADFIDTLLNLPLEETLYNTDNPTHIENCKRNKYHESRYHWLNLHSYYFRGTIEMRQHHGTKNPVTIINWAELWLKVAEWSKNKTLSEIRSASADKIITGCGLRSTTLDYFNNKKLSFYS